MTKLNPPITIFMGEAAQEVAEGRAKLHHLYRDQLAERLGVAPKERVSLAVVQDGEKVFISCLVDGGDLTPGQEDIFRQFLLECKGIAGIIGSLPEKPITS
jgi:hypothetical protein